jgi:hypothetical protein
MFDFLSSLATNLLTFNSWLVILISFALAPLLILDKILPCFGILEIAPLTLPLIINIRLSPFDICGINF